MRGFFTRSESATSIQASPGVQGEFEPLRKLMRQYGVVDTVSVKAQLYHVRKPDFTLPDGRRVVFYFEPEFVYVLDVGMSRLMLVTAPYQVPMVMDGSNPVTVGVGDAEFPEFAEARVFSCAGYGNTEILYPAVAGELLVGVEPGTPEADVQAALKPYVLGLSNQSAFYRAQVMAFDEPAIAKHIAQNVKFVRYAELNTIVRGVGNWLVDRVL